MVEQAPKNVSKIAHDENAGRQVAADAFWAKKGLNVAGVFVGVGTLFIPGLGLPLGTVTIGYNLWEILRKK